MKHSDLRSRTVLLASVALVLPGLTAEAGTPARSLVAGESGSFSAPAEEMVLTREWRRELSDGAIVRTLRTYHVQFTPDGAGYRVDGESVGVLVQVPPSLEALGAIERNRREAGLFPMFIDHNGVLKSPALAADQGAVEEAAAIVTRRIARSTLAPSDKARSAKFIASVARQPATSPWPATVFSPPPGRQQETRSVPLDDGRTGSLVIRSDAQVDSNSSLMQRFSRVVISRVGATSQATEEIWTLRRLPRR